MGAHGALGDRLRSLGVVMILCDDPMIGGLWSGAAALIFSPGHDPKNFWGMG